MEMVEVDGKDGSSRSECQTRVGKITELLLTRRLESLFELSSS